MSGRLSLRGDSARKVPLKLLVSICREAATVPDAPEELAIIDNNGRQSGFGNSTLFAEARRISQQLVAQGHLDSLKAPFLKYAGNAPHLSTGNIPHALETESRDTARMERDALIARIKSRMNALRMNPSAVSLRSGSNREYVRQFFDGKTGMPSAKKIKAIAEVLECDPHWLLDGSGPAPSSDPDAEPDSRSVLMSIIHEMDDDGIEDLTTIALAIKARTAQRKKKQETG